MRSIFFVLQDGSIVSTHCADLDYIGSLSKSSCTGSSKSCKTLRIWRAYSLFMAGRLWSYLKCFVQSIMSVSVNGNTL